MARERDPERTREAILVAATRELAAVGVAGARIDRIAAEANVNKRMIYHYFANKAGLCEAVFEAVLSPLEELLRADSAELLPQVLEQLAVDVSWRRIAAWEAFGHEDSVIDAGSGRHTAWQRLVALVADAQIEDRVPADLDAPQMTLALLSVAVFPRVFPQYTRMITGLTPDSTEFQRSQRQFQARLLNNLRRAAREPGKPRIRIKRTNRPPERHPETQ
jgi:AcrR family transcriptional regulator